MDLNKRLQPAIESGFLKAVTQLKNEYPDIALTDLFLQFDFSNNTLSFFDDEDHLLSTVTLPEWEKDDEKAVVKQLEKTIKPVIQKLNDKKTFDVLNLLVPFSIILVDESFETLAELYTTDSDQIVIGETLMGNWEKDLDDFMEKIAREF